jgi:hypothetical protein
MEAFKITMDDLQRGFPPKTERRKGSDWAHFGYRGDCYILVTRCASVIAVPVSLGSSLIMDAIRWYIGLRTRARLFWRFQLYRWREPREW